MKKSNLILFAVITLMSMILVTSHAQVTMNSPLASSVDEYGIFTKSKNATSGAVNLKAEKNFKKDYHRTTKAEWSTLSDNSLMCRFFMNNILYRAFYTAHGRWLYTASSYDASKLDKWIYNRIKSVYYNSTIVYVNQIDLVNGVNGKTIYIVEIQDEKSIKNLRVDDDEMEIVQEIEKQ
jgi:hypothetical protein